MTAADMTTAQLYAALTDTPIDRNGAADAPDLDASVRRHPAGNQVPQCAMTEPDRPAWTFQREDRGHAVYAPDGEVAAYAVGPVNAAIIAEGMSVYARLDDVYSASEQELAAHLDNARHDLAASEEAARNAQSEVERLTEELAVTYSGANAIAEQRDESQREAARQLKLRIAIRSDRDRVTERLTEKRNILDAVRRSRDRERNEVARACGIALPPGGISHSELLTEVSDLASPRAAIHRKHREESLLDQQRLQRIAAHLGLNPDRLHTGERVEAAAQHLADRARTDRDLAYQHLAAQAARLRSNPCRPADTEARR